MIHDYSFDPTAANGQDNKGNQGKHKGADNGKALGLAKQDKKQLEQDGSVAWHVHPRFRPYDQGPQDMRIQGTESGIHVDYLGKELDAAEAVSLIQ